MESANNGAISYLTGGDPNGDGATNDLMYIPKNQSDIIIVPDAGDPRTAAVEWTELNNFISQDPYLSKHRGEYAQRNGAILPYYQLYNFHFAQDFYVMAGKNKNTLEFTFDILNVGNFLDNNWGLAQVSAINGASSGGVTVLTYKGLDTTTGRPTYSFPYLDKTNLIPITNSYKFDTSTFSRWQAQIGLRYIFN
jgi:hypothetical protein